MSLLASAFREQVANTKDIAMKSEMTYSVSYPTGFLNMDFANGYIQEVNGYRRYELGISDGSMNMFISDSGVGKTTIATQIGCNIIKPFKTSCMFIEAAEVGFNFQRVKNLSGFDDDTFNKRLIIRDSGITTESIYERVKKVYDIKTANPEAYMYDTGMRDINGKPVMKFEPTVFLIDSVKMVLSEKGTEADSINNMSAALNANANSQNYSRMVPLCRTANIIMIFINHITTDINTGFLPKKAELAYLKQGEHLPGSKALIYMQNNIFRLDIKSKLKPDEGLYINGSVVSLDIVKSRTNTSSRAKCNLVFDQATGYNNELSLYMMLKDRKILEGSAVRPQLPGSEIKFTQKTFLETLYTNQEFYNEFVTVCVNVLKADLDAEYERIKEENKYNEAVKSPYQSMLDKLNSLSAA